MIQGSGRGGLLGLGIHRPVGMAMVVLAVTVFGLVSLGKLPVDLLPPIDYPSITVRTVYSGAAPADIEERVTERVEDALSTVNGIVRMRSSSRAEVSEVMLEFEWGSNLPFLVQDVRERLDRVFLPPGVDRPLILRYDPSLDPILRVALSGGRDLVRLRDVAERELERELEGLPGVAAVKVRGGLEDEIQVRLDPQRLAAFKITGSAVLQRLREENLNVPGGKLEEGSVEYVVRTLNEFKTLEEIEDLPIVVRGDRFIKLSDIATVARFHKDRDVILRVRGDEAVEVDVFREADANIVEAAKLVKDSIFGNAEQQAYWAGPMARKPIEELEEHEVLERQRMSNFIAMKLPSDLSLTLLSDQAEFVRASIDEVRSAGIVGGILAILVCFLFLQRLAATFVVALSIPISIVATFGPMYLSGVSLNVMSLGGLALGIGMLVDNTIVVLESITRCREEGDSPLDAALRGVREVGGAVTASTLTTIAVFAPIVFVEGVAGQTFGDQALTVVASLTISLAVALYFIPGLAARVDRSRKSKLAAADDALEDIGDAVQAESQTILQSFGGLFRGFRLPRKWYLWVLSVLLVAGGAAMLSKVPEIRESAYAEMRAETPELFRGEEKPELAKETQERLAIFQVAGGLLVLLGIWWLFEYVFLLAGRLLGITMRVAALSVRLLFTLVVAVLSVLMWPFSFVVSAILGAIQRVYPAFLRAALHAPAIVLLIVAVIGYFAWESTGKLGRELLPEVHQGELTAELILPAGSPLRDTDALASGLEARIKQIDGVVESAVLSGADRESVSTEEEGPHTARILVRTAGGADGRATEEAVEEGIRDILSGEPGVARFNIRRPTLLALQAPLEIEIQGEELAEIELLAREIEAELRSMSEITDLRTSVRRGNPEVLITLNRERLAEHGLQLADIANRLRLAVEGEVSSTFPGKDDRIDIRVRADLSLLKHIDQLEDIPVNPEAERPIPLGAVAELRIADGPSEIRHLDSRRAAVLRATPAGFDLGGVTETLEAKLASIPRPAGLSVEVGGQKAEMEASLNSLLFALMLAVFLVYAVMAAQFESLLQPFLIMFSVPLAAVGALYALIVTNTPLSVVALIGAVILAGIVVNNAIVLVDRINRNRREGLSLDDAIVEAGKTRLRPILMTTVTTVLGMIPLTGWLQGAPIIGDIGAAEGTELRAPMALVVIAGLSASTLLTLVVIPTGYRLLALISPQERRHA